MSFNPCLGLLLFLGAALACGSSTGERPARTADPSPRASPAPIAVWMDVDPYVAPGGHEPDDGLALVQAFHSPELELVGVSAVFGNSPIEIGFPNAQEIVSRFGPEGLPVYEGAPGRDALGEETDASRAIASALEAQPLSILALGPVTNVATVVLNHPELSERIERVIAVAGRRPGQPFVLGNGDTPLMDFNFELDPDGFQVLLDSGVPIVLAPFEISSRTPLSEEAVERFASVPELASFYLEPLRDRVDWFDELFGIRVVIPWDTLGVAYLTSPEWLACDELPVQIQTLASDTEPDEDKPYLLVSSELPSHRRVTYCHTASDAFIPDLERRLLAP